MTYPPATLMRHPGDMLLAARANLLIPTTLVMVVGGVAVFIAAEDLVRVYAGTTAYFGFLFGCCISFGTETKRYIQEARGHFHDAGELPAWFVQRASKWYCFRSGVAAWAKQDGHGYTLPGKFTNPLMTPTLL